MNSVRFTSEQRHRVFGNFMEFLPETPNGRSACMLVVGEICARSRGIYGFCFVLPVGSGTELPEIVGIPRRNPQW